MAQRIQDRLFQLDEGKNELVRLNSVSYSELELYENTNLHEWLAKEIKSLGEDLLVIQREHTAVKETQRRPDIVALDGSGRVGGAGHKHLISTMEYRIWYGRGEGRNVNEYMPWMHHIRPSFNDHLKQGEKYVFNYRGRSFWAGPDR